MKAKRLDFEILRIISIFLVVFNHTQLRGYELYQISELGSFNYNVSMFLALACKIAVPLFFMVSGGLLLHRNEPITVVLKKRVVRILAALVLFSGILYGFQIYWGYIASPGVYDFLKRLWHSGMNTPYWYLYAYLGLMLMLPLLRPMAQNMSNQMYRYLFLLHVVYYGVIVPFGIVAGFGMPHSDFAIPLIERTLFYFLMGYYMAHRFDFKQIKSKHLWLLVAAGLLGICLNAALIDLNYKMNGAYAMDELLCYLWIPIFAVYVLVHYLTEKHPPRGFAAKAISQIGGCVFGAYLLEGILRGALDGVYVALEPWIHVLPACLVWVTAVTVCGLGVTMALRQIPGVKKLV